MPVAFWKVRGRLTPVSFVTSRGLAAVASKRENLKSVANWSATR